MNKRLFVFLLWIKINISYGLDIIDEALLLTCQANGHKLYSMCVLNIPVTPDELATCTTLKTSYVLCLRQLNMPLPLTASNDPDPYANNPFTPCFYETGHMVLYDICRTL